MKIKALLLMLALAGSARAAIPQGYAERVCAAIHAAEGGKKASVPYGILTVPTRSEAHAKAICLNTVKRSWNKWESAKKPGDFIEYLGATYCPIKGPLSDNERKLNPNWVKNVRYFLARSEGLLKM